MGTEREGEGGIHPCSKEYDDVEHRDTSWHQDHRWDDIIMTDRKVYIG